MSNTQKSNTSQCAFCKTSTKLRCQECQTPICKKHTYIIRKKYVCQSCLMRERKKGLILSWVFVGLLALGAALVIFIF